LCHRKKRGIHPLPEVLIGEHGIKNPLHAHSIREHPHRSGTPSQLPKPSFNGIGGPPARPPIGVLDSKEAHELFFIHTKTLNRLGADLIPSCVERSQSRLGLTEDYGIKYAISRSYRFLREIMLPKAYFWADLFLFLGLGYEGHTHNEKGIVGLARNLRLQIA
jgi:hypothetical protein